MSTLHADYQPKMSDHDEIEPPVEAKDSFTDNFTEIQRPDWVPDEQQKECFICSKEFSLLVRKVGDFNYYF